MVIKDDKDLDISLKESKKKMGRMLTIIVSQRNRIIEQ